MIIGIDLGTTNSLVSVLQDGEPRILSNEMGERLTPSVVALAEDGATLVGVAARERRMVSPDSGVARFKNDMGMTKRYQIGATAWSPVECSAIVLNEMKRIAEMNLGQPVTEAVITVPAYFRDEQRNATMEAADIAGLNVKRLINEPTAAALAYGYRHADEEKNLFIFDLGGGTFDVTLLEIFDGVIEVKASGGVSRLGGEDFTDALRKAIEERESVVIDGGAYERFRQQVELAQRRLSQQEETSLTIQGRDVSITRDDFAKSARELCSRIRPVISRCLRDAGESLGDLDDVLLVGGASRMPVIISLVSEELSQVPNQSMNPDEVVALGAAVQAGLIAGDQAVEDLVLTDVCSHTLGIETSHQMASGRYDAGYFAPLIDRNTTIPVSKSDIFSTLTPDQDQVRLRVYQGEARKVEGNRFIGEVRMSGLRRGPNSTANGSFHVRFTYDMNGLLEVEATNDGTGEKVSKIFEDRPGTLTEAEKQEAMARLGALKIHPRDKLPNRARIERANRLYEELMGAHREQLSQVLLMFENALETQDDAEISGAAEVLDQLLAHYLGED